MRQLFSNVLVFVTVLRFLFYVLNRYENLHLHQSAIVHQYHRFTSVIYQFHLFIAIGSRKSFYFQPIETVVEVEGWIWNYAIVCVASYKRWCCLLTLNSTKFFFLYYILANSIFKCELNTYFNRNQFTVNFYFTYNIYNIHTFIHFIQVCDITYIHLIYK